MIRGDGETSGRNDKIQEVLKHLETKRLKQMEIEFVKRVAETWPTLSPEIIPEGKKCVKTRRKTLKKLATENGKVSNWLVSKPFAREEGNPEQSSRKLLGAWPRGVLQQCAC